MSVLRLTLFSECERSALTASFCRSNQVNFNKLLVHFADRQSPLAPTDQVPIGAAFLHGGRLAAGPVAARILV